MPQLIVTAVGPDRPGIVGEITSHLHAGGANILDTRMVNLRGEFAMLILLEAPEGQAKGIERELPALGQRAGLRVTVSTQQAAAERAVQGLPYRLKTYSMDQPGIVARLTAILRNHSVNIEELSARQESAPFAGSPLFVTELRLTVPASVALGRLRAELEGLGNELNCDVDLDPD